MTQYSHNINLNDSELGLAKRLIDEHIDNLKKNNIPVGLFAINLNKKLIRNTSQSNHQD